MTKNRNMESIFRQLERAGKADVEHLVQWMKDSNVIKAAENNPRRIFQYVKNPQHIELEQFKYILNELAAQESTSIEQLTKQLATEGPMFIDGVIAGLNPIKDAFKLAGPAVKKKK